MDGLQAMWDLRYGRPEATREFLKLARRVISKHHTLRHVASKHPFGHEVDIWRFGSEGITRETVHVTFIANEKDCQEQDGTVLDVDEAIRGWKNDDRFESIGY